MTSAHQQQLATAIQTGNLDRFRQLIQRIDPNSTDRNGKPILYIAIEGQQPEMCEELLNHGADIETKFRGYSSLGFAMSLPVLNPRIVEVLLRKGADPEHPWNQLSPLRDQLSPLQIAIARRNEAAVRLLLQYGASVDNKTLISDAVRNGVEGIMNILLEHGAPLEDDIIEKFIQHNVHLPVTMLQSLLGHGAKMINMSLHMQYLEENYPEILTLLIRYGCPIPEGLIRRLRQFTTFRRQGRNVFGDTPLTKAIRENNVDEVHRLLDAAIIVSSQQLVPPFPRYDDAALTALLAPAIEEDGVEVPPIVLAARLRHRDIFDILVDHQMWRDQDDLNMLMNLLHHRDEDGRHLYQGRERQMYNRNNPYRQYIQKYQRTQKQKDKQAWFGRRQSRQKQVEDSTVARQLKDQRRRVNDRMKQALERITMRESDQRALRMILQKRRKQSHINPK